MPPNGPCSHRQHCPSCGRPASRPKHATAAMAVRCAPMVSWASMSADRSRAPFQTQHALEASDLAAALNESWKKVRIGPGDYVPELMAPQGPSTAGGVQAMQHLRLVSTQAGLP